MSPHTGSADTVTAGRRRRLALAVGASAIALALGVAVCAPAASSDSADSLTAATSTSTATSTATATAGAQSCAWPTQITIQTSDVGGPDSAASYWLQPIVADANTRFIIAGKYPDARYASLAVYTPSGSAFTSNGVSDSLTDYQIAPDPGSRNPWRQYAAPGGRFTVSIRSDVSPRQHNTLPMPPGTTMQHPGYLLLRVYGAAGGDFSRVPLPTVIVQQGRTTRPLFPCREHNAPVPPPVTSPTPSASATGTPAPTPPQLEFFRPSDALVDSGLPNVDTGYAMAYLLRPSASDVVVVTAKAPVAAPGDHPSPWPAPGEDMRYWSMCVIDASAHLPTVINTLPNGQVDYGCRNDGNTVRDSAGDYTYVVGAESQRAAVESVPGATFLPFATDQTSPLYILLLRNLLTAPQFTESAQSIPEPSDPAAAAAVMGPYYPHAAVCSLTVLTTQGVQACMSSGAGASALGTR
jgi:hypothetical protein